MKLNNEMSKHWFKLPLHLRVRWWQETNYGKDDPNEELLQAMNDAIKLLEEVTHR